MKPRRKFRRKTLRQWAAFARRGARRGTYARDHHLHAFEDEVIQRKLAEHGGEAGPHKLASLYPDLFERRYLPRAMKRMEQQGKLKRTGHGRYTRWVTYGLPGTNDASRRAA